MTTKKLSEAGFDLTDFPSVKSFKKVLVANKMRYVGRTPKGPFKSSAFVFKGKGVEMHTGNNPITGRYSTLGRPSEKGYASYIGIKGEKSKVAKLTKSIRKSAKYIKEFNPRRNDYIW